MASPALVLENVASPLSPEVVEVHLREIDPSEISADISGCCVSRDDMNASNENPARPSRERDAQAKFSILGLLQFSGTGFMAAVAFLDPVSGCIRHVSPCVIYHACAMLIRY